MLSLKRTHAYFTQVQFQMAVTGRLWTDFVVFTVPDEGKEDGNIIVERIPFSPVFWKKKLLPAVKTVFTKFIVLELLTRCVRRGIPLLGQ